MSDLGEVTFVPVAALGASTIQFATSTASTSEATKYKSPHPDG